MAANKSIILICIICTLSYIVAVENIIDVFKFFNVRIPLFPRLMLDWWWPCMGFGLLSYVAQIKFKYGIPVVFTGFVFSMSLLISPLFMFGCLHGLELDVTEFLIYGFGIVPISWALVAALWIWIVWEKKISTNQALQGSTLRVPFQSPAPGKNSGGMDGSGR